MVSPPRRGQPLGGGSLQGSAEGEEKREWGKRHLLGAGSIPAGQGSLAPLLRPGRPHPKLMGERYRAEPNPTSPTRVPGSSSSHSASQWRGGDLSTQDDGSGRWTDIEKKMVGWVILYREREMHI